MKKLFLIFLLLLFASSVSAATYYVAATASGSEDGSSSSDPCAIATIPWSTIETELESEDVYVQFKRGDTFGQLSVLN